VLDAFEPLSAEARLLILCARMDLRADGEQALTELLDGSLDWPAILNAADQHFIMPLLARHLSGRGGAAVPDAVRAAVRDRHLRWAMQALQLARVQQVLVERVFGPAGVRHAFFKGATLAQSYYGDPAQRQYRDIDVLVEAARIAEVGQALLGLGYHVTNTAWETFRQRDLRAFCRYSCALEMRSPQGVLVELHKTVDSTGCIFASDQLLARSHMPAQGRYAWQTLAPADLFVYLCYHHARHRWSSLHWCADLDVLTRHPDFEPVAVSRTAQAVALDLTLQEALRLNEDLLALALGKPGNSDRPASRFLADCLAAVDAALTPDPETATPMGDPASDGAEIVGQSEPDFLYDWQFSRRYRRRFQLFRWRPSANDVDAWPLPLGLHWLYYLWRPIRVASARLFRGSTAPAHHPTL